MHNALLRYWWSTQSAVRDRTLLVYTVVHEDGPCSLASFSKASELIQSVARLCDALDHHPTITINEAKVCERVGGCGELRQNLGACVACGRVEAGGYSTLTFLKARQAKALSSPATAPRARRSRRRQHFSV